MYQHYYTSLTNAPNKKSIYTQAVLLFILIMTTINNDSSSQVLLASSDGAAVSADEGSKSTRTTTHTTSNNSTIGLSKRIKRIFNHSSDITTTATAATNNNQNNNSNDSNNNNNNQVNRATATKAPKDTLQAVYAAGKYKAGLSLDVLCIQSTMAGIFIAFAGQLYLSVGGGILGAVLFPGGLIAVILTSAELFTGDALIFVASVLGGQVPIHRLVRNWCVSWYVTYLHLV
jgi:hypothetical protein